MSNTNVAYPQSTDGLALIPGYQWPIREDEASYSATLLELTDAVNDRLEKAEALAWVLHGSKEYPENALAPASAAIAELIHEARERHAEQWEIIRQRIEWKD